MVKVSFEGFEDERKVVLKISKLVKSSFEDFDDGKDR
jgi:hypothetical protein